MTKVNFKYDEQKDIWSQVFVLKSQPTLENYGKKSDEYEFIPYDLAIKIKKASFGKGENLLKNFFDEYQKSKLLKKIIKNNVDAIKNSWEINEKDFFQNLERLTGKPIFSKNINCYVTTNYMCLYDPRDKSFTTSIFRSIPWNITTICHEIFHLQFSYYYKNYCLKFLSEPEFAEFNEIITFFLNTDFSNIIILADGGYPAHQTIRYKLQKEWIKNKDFNSFLDIALKIYLKKKV